MFLRVWFSQKDVEDLSPLTEHFGAFRDSKPATYEAIGEQILEDAGDNVNYGRQNISSDIPKYSVR